MRLMAVVGAALVGIGLFAAGTPAIARSDRPVARTQAAAPTDVSAQARRRTRRAPTQITVSPHRKLVRECSAWYALEHRPSGDVVTPQMRCWWAAQ